MTHADSTDLADFNLFLFRREQAANAYACGDAGPLGELMTRGGPASFFGPGGGHVDGASAVWARYEKDAGGFAPGGSSHLEVMHRGASAGLAWWTGLQHAVVHLVGKEAPVAMHLRVTEVFQRDDGSWKLIHRHADMLAEAQKR
jgi:hypothetical protein